MGYFLLVCRKRKLYLRIGEGGSPIICGKKEAKVFDEIKAQNVLDHLPKVLQKMNFVKEPVVQSELNISDEEEIPSKKTVIVEKTVVKNTSYNKKKKKIIKNTSYKAPQNVMSWVDRVAQCKHNTLGIGLIGVAEMCVALFGKNHAEDSKVHEFALSVVKRIYDYAKEASERNDLNFGCYFTPAEGLCRTALKSLREQYGIIPNVTSHEYLTNSVHVPVWQKVSIYDKLRIEAPFTKYATSGCITYIELESTFVQNTKAVEDIIDYAFDVLDIPYLAFNFPIDSCLDCGYQGEFNNECPECGSKNIQQLRRVTGYLTTDYRNFNEGKQAEVEERVKHSAYTSFGDEEK